MRFQIVPLDSDRQVSSRNQPDTIASLAPDRNPWHIALMSRASVAIGKNQPPNPQWRSLTSRTLPVVQELAPH
ncbi:hypothetical protein NG795_18535 [Laspinema sp. D3]|nr:hypothetical protein [Laspinema sp. D2c]